MAHHVTNHRGPEGRKQASQIDQSADTEGDDVQSSVRNVASQFADQASEYWSEGREQMQECMRGREGAALMMAAAAGLGVGLALGATLGRTHRKQLSWRDRVTAEGFGRRLMERIESMIPDALADHFTK